MLARFLIKFILIFIQVVFVITFSQGQKHNGLLQKNKKTLDSLFPNATDISLNGWETPNTNQLITFHCNCSETTDEVIILFDTIGNILYTEFHYHTLILLPDTLVKYTKIKTSSTITFNDHYMTKRISNKGEISYGIIENDRSNSASAGSYLLKFKSSGELISKTNQSSYR